MTKRTLRSPREIKLMRKAGLLVWQAHQAAAKLVRPGVTTGTLNEAIAQTFRRHDALPLFLNYPGATPFPAETCISINDEVVHGIPGSRLLKNGDIVSIDTGCRIGGWCGDAAVTHPVGQISANARALLDVTSGVLNLAIELMGKNEWWSEVALEMQEFVEAAGFSVVTSMVGHGIGREMHEPPQVPNYYSKDFTDKEDFDLRPGLVVAVEPMVNAGVEELEILDDDWTAVTADGKLSAHFEHTIAMTKDGPKRLTAEPSEEELEWVDPEHRDRSSWLKW